MDILIVIFILHWVILFLLSCLRAYVCTYTYVRSLARYQQRFSRKGHTSRGADLVYSRPLISEVFSSLLYRA
jgi:hypothetical protein